MHARIEQRYRILERRIRVAGSLNSTGREIDETGRGLCAYSTMVNLEIQDDGSADATQHRSLSKSWLARSA